MKRRDFITTSTLGGLSLAACSPLINAKKNQNKVLRIVHVTDMHIQPDEVAIRGIQNLLQEIERLDEKPDFIINTGDNIMDSLKQPKEKVEELWDTWKTHFHDKINIPLYNCIGNHDVWGWELSDPQIETDTLYGKGWALKMFGMQNRYYSFEKKGWKVICLDSPFHDKEKVGYTAKLDDEQFNWLKETLESTPENTHIMIASHIPILSPSVFFDGENETSGNWNVPGAWMHIDARKIKDLFHVFQRPILAISGHVHLIDKVKYLNADYLCNGAACGKWWHGSYQEFAPAFAVIDLFDDGSYNNQIINYKWNSDNA